MSLFNELKRRNVFRVSVAYLLAAWVLLQVVDFVLDAISAPNWILQVFILAAAVGLPVVLIFAWVFEITPEGVKRESEIDRSKSITPNTGRKLDRVIIAFLAVAVMLLLADRFTATERTGAAATAEPVGRSAAEILADAKGDNVGEKSIAVLPFLALSSGQDDEYFADGLTEEILNALAQLPELLVTARTSSFYFKGKDISIQEIAAKLGVSAVVEGSVRRAGERLRVTAQLIRAADGFHVWSENYDSTSSDTITVQEDIAEKIATAMDVVMDDQKREAMRRAGLRDVEAFIAMQKGLELFENAHGDPEIIAKLRQANEYFEKVSERVPAYAPAYLQHSDLYVHQLMSGASGEIGGVTEPADVEEAKTLARADYEAVLRYASTPEERNSAELDLAFTSGDWRGLSRLVELYLADRGCSGAMWDTNLEFPFGYARESIPKVQEFTVCDPLSSSVWRAAVRAHLWAGDPESALQTARRGSEQAPGEWLSIQLISALVALGKFEQAELEVAERLRIEADIVVVRTMIAAAQGNRITATGLLNQYEQSPQPEDANRLLFNAWIGDRDKANQIAARIDRHAFGSPSLTVSLLWCLCGAPWDLSATPNFAADIAESGLTWPPPTPIQFPLKDW